MRRISPRALVLIAALLLNAVRTDGAAPEPKVFFDADIGLGQFVRLGRWFPVRLLAFNPSGRDITGGFIVEVNEPTAARVFTPLVLPRKSKTIHFLYQRYPGWRETVTARFAGDDRKTEYSLSHRGGRELELLELPADGMVGGVLGPDRKFLPSTAGKHLLVIRPNRSTSPLPDHWAGYDMLDWLVIAQADAGQAQIQDGRVAQALIDWVARGGRLVAPINLRGELGERLRKATDADAPREAEEHSVSLNQLAAALASSGGSESERVKVFSLRGVAGKTLISVESQDLAVRTPLAAGSVVWTAFTPADRTIALAASPLRDALWRRLLPAAPVEDPAAEQYDRRLLNAAEIFSRFNARVMRKHVGAGWLLLFAFIYIAVIGPLDYILVRRLGWPALTWLSYPALIAGFALLGAWYSNNIQVVKMTAREITFLDVASGRPHQRVRGYAGIVSPRNDVYTVAPAGRRELIEPITGESEGTAGTLGRAPRLGLSDNAPPQLAIGIPINTVRTFYIDGIRDADAPLLTITREQNDWVIENNTGSRIEDAAIVLREKKSLRLQALHTVGTGSSSKEVRLRSANVKSWIQPSEVRSLYNDWRYRRTRFDASKGTSKSLGGRDFILGLSFNRRVGPIRHSYGIFIQDAALDLSHILDEGDAVFIGRLTAEPDALVTLAGRRQPRRISEVWIRCRIPLAKASGRARLPPSR